jgi:hypothetical protein
MRLSSLAPAVLIVSLSAPALAQEWQEFESQQDRFTCNFPGDPKITDTTSTSQFGHRLAARVYSVELAGNHRFSVTVVDYRNITELGLQKQKSCPAGSEACRGGSGAPGNSTGPGYSKADKAGAITYATWQFMQRDAKVTHLLWTNISLVEGHQIRLLNNADKSLTAASVFMHEDKLYIAEGTVPAGYPEPGLFYQSLGFLDENGNGIRYAEFYHNGFPKPALQGGGGGAAPAGRGQGNQGGRGQGAGGAGAGRGNQPR